jgi:hypothetical protein
MGEKLCTGVLLTSSKFEAQVARQERGRRRAASAVRWAKYTAAPYFGPAYNFQLVHLSSDDAEIFRKGTLCSMLRFGGVAWYDFALQNV